MIVGTIDADNSDLRTELFCTVETGEDGPGQGLAKNGI